MRRVVITGIGALTPIGNNIKEFWNHLLKGTSGANKITRFDTAKFKTDFACEVKNFDPLEHFDRKEARKLDRFNQFGLVAAEEAIKDSEIDFEKMDKNRVGVIWSSGIGGFETFEEEVIQYTKSDFNPRFNPFFITKIIANSVAGLVSIKHGLRGVNSCPVTACSSSAQGIIQAYNYIKWGKADMIISGGSEAPITQSSIGGFNSMKAMSTNNEEYKSASRPFDTTRDGFVIGEGAGALLIESLESALKRNAKIYAEIGGGGESADAYHITNTHPDGLGAHLAMKLAIEEADIEPHHVQFINAHATSTGVGDVSEINAIKNLFEDHTRKLHINATKSMTGHLLGAAGAVEAIITALAVQKNVIPPTINTKSVDGMFKDLNFSLKTKTEKNIEYALSNSFGFGGHCASILFRKYIGL